MSQTFTLSDGVEVELSDRKSNRSGYTGAALSPSWTLDADKPFIAACGNPNDPKVMAEVNAQHRTSLHLGSYSDAREAAYVVGMYRKDPVATIRHIQQYGSVDVFPQDLYQLPPGLSYNDAVILLKNRKVKSKSKTKIIQKADPSTVPAKGNLYTYFTREQIVPIAKQAGGPEAFQFSLVGLTVKDFAEKFALVV
jgi:hypothetical protein